MPMPPTVAQLQQMFRICASLTNMFMSVHLVCIDRRTNDLIVIAGEETQAVINTEVEVEYRD
jgi:hypothetical protein